MLNAHMDWTHKYIYASNLYIDVMTATWPEWKED
jgi:hypothetical protein